MKLPMVAVHRTLEISLTTTASDGHVPLALAASLSCVRLFPQATKDIQLKFTHSSNIK